MKPPQPNTYDKPTRSRKPDQRGRVLTAEQKAAFLASRPDLAPAKPETSD